MARKGNRKKFDRKKWDKRLKKGVDAVKDGSTVAKGVKNLNPIEGAKSLGKQISEGNYPLSGRYNRTKDLVAISSDAVVHSAQNLQNMFKDTGMQKPNETRKTGTSYNDPNFKENQSRKPSGGGNMNNRNFGSDGASGQHPSRQYSGDSSAVPINPFSDNTVTNNPIRLSSYLERQYQLNPYQDQRGPVVGDINNENTWRTVFNLIDIDKNSILDFDDNTRMQYAFKRVYMQLRGEMIDAVNANQFTNQVFNYDNFFAYIQQVCECWALYTEIKTRISFTSTYAEQNLVLRNLSGQMAGDTGLLVALEQLETIIKKFALPVKVIEYYKWLFQTYKATPVEGGLHYSQMSCYFYSALRESENDQPDWSELIAKLNTLTQTLYDSTDYNSNTQIGNWTTMSQYLVKHCKTGNWTDVGNFLSFCSEPIYDVNTNAIWDNKVAYVADSAIDPMYGRLATASDASVAFPHDEDCVPAFVSAHLLPLWGEMDFTQKYGCTAGFPLFSTYMKDAHLTNPTNQRTENTIILQTSAAGGGAGWGCIGVNAPNEFITDHIWEYLYTGAGQGFGMIRAKGLNTRYYSPSYTNTTTACVNFMYDVFGVDLDYS